MVLPNMMEKSEREKLAGMSAYTHTRSFQEGDRVWVKDLRSTTASKWCKGTIKDVLGTLTYNVKLADGHQRTVHLDHPRLREKEWGVIPSSDEEMPRASIFGQPQNDTDIQLDTSPVGGGGGGGGSFLPQVRKCQEQVHLGNLRMTQTSNWILVQCVRCPRCPLDNIRARAVWSYRHNGTSPFG